MELFVRLAKKTIMGRSTCAQRTVTMLFVLDVLNALSLINSKLPEEFLQLIILDKTIYFAIAATK